MIKDSVSAVFLCQGKIFVIRRQDTLAAFPGYVSFPGGKVDSNEARRPWKGDLASFDPKKISALVREIREELHYDLASSEEILQVQEYATAQSPEFSAQKFFTTFYLIRLKVCIPFKVDPGEIQEAFWATPQDFEKDYQASKILAVPPTVALVRSLLEGPADRKNRGPFCLDHLFCAEEEVPYVEMLGGVRQLLPLSNTFPPANRTNAFLLGEPGTKQVLIDPSPQDSSELQKLYATLKKRGASVDEIFLTHHHRDHHEHAPEMARFWKIPMGMSLETSQRIRRLWGEGYLKGLALHLYEEGDTLATLRGEEVRLLSVPGHDAGQMAPYVESGKWMIVGDLIQSVGTVLIGGDEGDMQAYFASLEQVIKMNPKVVFPSHGMPLGGVAHVKRTWEHRKFREQQILGYLEEGKEKEEILELVYEGLSPSLLPYARMTLDAHLQKIAKEKRGKDSLKGP